MQPDLVTFLDTATVGSRKNAYVKFPGIKSLYVRYTQRYIADEIASPCLDIANIEAMKPGNGAFTKMLKYLRKNYPELWIYVECVLNERFEKKLPKLGFIQVSLGLSPCFYMPPAKRKTNGVQKEEAPSKEGPEVRRRA